MKPKTIIAPDGVTLTARDDRSLARAYAQHIWGDAWDTISPTEQADAITRALAKIRGTS